MIPCDKRLLAQSNLCEPSNLAFKVSLYSLYVHGPLWNVGASHNVVKHFPSKSLFLENFSDC